MNVKHVEEARQNRNDIQRRVIQEAIDHDRFQRTIGDELRQTISDGGTRNRERVEAGEAAWGQYLGEAVTDFGTYGTSAALQILCLGDSTDGIPAEVEQDRESYLERGQEWLERQWTDSKSKTRNRRDRAVVYRCDAFCQSTCIDGFEHPLYDDACEHVWGMQIGKEWGQFHYGPDAEHNDESNELATAVALYSLSNWEKALTGEYAPDYGESLLRLKQRVESHQSEIGDKQFLTEASLCLIALSRFCCNKDIGAIDSDRQPLLWKLSQDPGVHAGLKAKVGELVKRLQSTVATHSDPTFYADRFYVRLYSTPLPERQYRYIPFIIGPLVSLAFMEAGKCNAKHVENNLVFVESNVSTFADKVENGTFESGQRGLASIGDHKWIAELFQSYIELDDEELNWWRVKSSWLRFVITRQRALVFFLAIVVLVNLVAIVAAPDLFNPVIAMVSAVFGTVFGQVFFRR